jgi:hypothetical protein
MQAEILELIRARQNVSFAELVRDVAGFAAADPAEACDLGTDHPGVLLWAGLSHPAFDALRSLQTAGRIRAKPCGLMVYCIDGITLSLPVAKPGRQYRRPHWLPVCWSTVD